jgi:hypothetical protein
MAKKWLPVSHRHGCAIYRHKNVSAEQQGVIGGELMVSAIIKGTPEQCLAALTRSNCGNSILGPATAVEELQHLPDGGSKVRIAWCAFLMVMQEWIIIALHGIFGASCEHFAVPM